MNQMPLHHTETSKVFSGLGEADYDGNTTSPLPTVIIFLTPQDLWAAVPLVSAHGAHGVPPRPAETDQILTGIEAFASIQSSGQVRGQLYILPRVHPLAFAMRPLASRPRLQQTP